MIYNISSALKMDVEVGMGIHPGENGERWSWHIRTSLEEACSNLKLDPHLVHVVFVTDFIKLAEQRIEELHDHLGGNLLGHGGEAWGEFEF